jgi:hypothetical protein
MRAGLVYLLDVCGDKGIVLLFNRHIVFVTKPASTKDYVHNILADSSVGDVPPYRPIGRDGAAATT